MYMYYGVEPILFVPLSEFVKRANNYKCCVCHFKIYFLCPQLYYRHKSTRSLFKMTIHMQCSATDMVYYLYLLLKITVANLFN